LGFEYVSGADSIGSYYVCNNRHLRHYLNSNKVIIEYIDGEIDFMLFRGTVKNKSELKRILKQIDYE
jgi:hypothetical protein